MLRVKRERAGEHDALLLPAREARAALGDDRVEPLRQASDEVVELGGLYRELDVRILHRIAERDILAQRKIEHDAVLEDEADLLVQTFLSYSSISLPSYSIVPEVGASKAGQKIQKLRLPCRRRADDGRLACPRPP